MTKNITQMIKGIAIIIMIAHHFIVIPFSELPYLVTLFGYSCKICVAIYAVLSGFGYFYAKDKTVKYGLRKIWSLLQIYWLSLFTLFIPLAIVGGWKLTPSNLIIQLFGLLPNLNWFAWYVFFYIFCMMVMPFICKYRLLRFNPIVNLVLILLVPYILEVGFHIIPNYEENVVLHDLFSCFLYFPCFLIGYWIAENKFFEKVKKFKLMNNPWIGAAGIIVIFSAIILVKSVAGFSLSVFYAPALIFFFYIILDKLHNSWLLKPLEILGKYSTGMWFFHAVFFSTYVCDIFQPILSLVKQPVLMFLWLIILSLVGAFVYQKILNAIKYIPKIIERCKN